MSNKCFAFKQFAIAHDKCAMKVGTDGVLLGAWVSIDNTNLILEIGTGSGLIALMVAQRSGASIVAIEIDELAAKQAKENVVATNWANRIEVINEDFVNYSDSRKYDLIISNPPYFENSLISPSDSRSKARHTDSLSYNILVTKSSQMLSEIGRLCLIIPAESGEKIVNIAVENGLHLTKKIDVLPKPGRPAKRILLEFSKLSTPIIIGELIIEISRHQYSDDYISLTKSFYLKM